MPPSAYTHIILQAQADFRAARTAYLQARIQAARADLDGVPPAQCHALKVRYLQARITYEEAKEHLRICKASHKAAKEQGQF